MAQYKNIDIVPDSTVNRIHLSQGDIGRTLIFYLFENALSWSVPASSTIKCQGTKPSGFGFSVSCTYSGNTVTCVTTEEMTDEYGQIEAELVITSSDESQVFGTSNFILDIEKNPHPASTEDGNVETAIALTARITALESAVGDIDDLETEADDLVGAINEIASGGSGGSGGSGLTDDIKQALLQLASKVAYIDDDGQDYYDALEDALYPPAELASITCVYTQSGTVYDTASLNSLKSNLVVTAHMTNSSTSTVPGTAYTLSGTLSAGTSTITVSYGGKTTTFTVTVTAAPTLSSISAVYTQSGTVYDTDSLDSLKSDLVVTATYSDSSTATVSSSDYTLSGTLTTGTSTITVSYGGKTTTFSVTVTTIEIGAYSSFTTRRSGSGANVQLYLVKKSGANRTLVAMNGGHHPLLYTSDSTDTSLTLYPIAFGSNTSISVTSTSSSKYSMQIIHYDETYNNWMSDLETGWLDDGTELDVSDYAELNPYYIILMYSNNLSMDSITITVS